MNIELEIEKSEEAKQIPDGMLALIGGSDLLHVFDERGRHLFWYSTGDIGRYSNYNYPLSSFQSDKPGTWKPARIKKIIVEEL